MPKFAFILLLFVLQLDLLVAVNQADVDRRCDYECIQQFLHLKNVSSNDIVEPFFELEIVLYSDGQYYCELYSCLHWTTFLMAK